MRFASELSPYAVAMKTDEPFYIAAIWEEWKHRQTDAVIRTFAVVTYEANELMATIHPRMPVIIADSFLSQQPTLGPTHFERPRALPYWTRIPSVRSSGRRRPDQLEGRAARASPPLNPDVACAIPVDRKESCQRCPTAGRSALSRSRSESAFGTAPNGNRRRSRCKTCAVHENRLRVRQRGWNCALHRKP
ncbi:SOS response-associated peptidase [Chelativorans salis]|uniref:SOS response-associated peptidase n=1 Tax=Chelativorans salis TaxID=2978478 RepID=A0ABT2LS73_9HYPH|nr:SOS response-associated peptidase [Chelativorans sp. EGI FJ00035]MCT7376949.1 SOS response-associated peptidase [Chelativorans sp. EGI FJ00035]